MLVPRFFEILSRIISLATIYIIYIPIIGGKTTAQTPSHCRRHTHPGKAFIRERGACIVWK